MTKKATQNELQKIANQYGIPLANLSAVIEVESHGSGFDEQGRPTILFEPHVFWQQLGKKGYLSLRNKMQAASPSLIYPKWGMYPYGSKARQHDRLDDAIKTLHQVLPALDDTNLSDQKIVNDVRAAALESCSWGLGQVMGYHWTTLGYDSLQAFVNAMYRDEASQIDAMMRFIARNGLINALKNKQWTTFARAYNGAGYKLNRYDDKLQQAYLRYSDQYSA